MPRPRFKARGGPKRQTTWVGPADQGYIAVATTAKVLVGSFDPEGSGLPKPTVIRTRGELSVIPNPLTATAEVVGAWGLAIVSDQAFAIGITAVPGPFDEADWDGWFAWGSFSFNWAVADATGRQHAAVTIVVDSKGMRKVTTNETIVLVAQSQTGAFQISMPVRLLLKLS